MDDKLGFVCLRWATRDGEENESDVGGSVKENDFTVPGSGLEQFVFRLFEYCACRSEAYCCAPPYYRAAGDPSSFLR